MVTPVTVLLIEVNCWQRTSSMVSSEEAESLYGSPPNPLEMIPLAPKHQTYRSKIKYHKGVHNGIRYFTYALY